MGVGLLMAVLVWRYRLLVEDMNMDLVVIFEKESLFLRRFWIKITIITVCLANVLSITWPISSQACRRYNKSL